MLTLIPSVHATILSIAVAVVIVIVPILYQKTLNYRITLEEKLRETYIVFSSPYITPPQFSHKYDELSDQDFTDQIRVIMKDIYFMQSPGDEGKGSEYDSVLCEKLIDLFEFISFFSRRSPFFDKGEYFDDLINSDIIRYHSIKNFFNDLHFNLEYYLDDVFSKIDYYDMSIVPKLKNDAYNKALADRQAHNNKYYYGKAVDLNDFFDSTSVNASAENYLSQYRINYNYKKMLIDFKNRVDFVLSGLIHDVLDVKSNYEEIKNSFDIYSSVRIIYFFILLIMFFGIVFPLLLNEVIVYCNVDVRSNIYLEMVFLLFSLTFVPYFIGLRNAYREFKKLKI